MPRPLTTSDRELLARLAEGDNGLHLDELSGNGRRVRDVHRHLRWLGGQGLAEADNTDRQFWRITPAGRRVLDRRTP